MPPFLLANASVVAVVAVFVAMFLVGGFKLGIDLTVMTLIGLAVLTGVLAWLVFLLNKQLKERTLQARQGRFMSERLQAMLATAPGVVAASSRRRGFCARRCAHRRFCIEKLAQIQDIVAAVKDASAFVDGFRALQQMDVLRRSGRNGHGRQAGADFRTPFPRGPRGAADRRAVVQR